MVVSSRCLRSVPGKFRRCGNQFAHIYTDDTRREIASDFHTIRQQIAKRSGQPNFALADFVAPADTGIEDYIGAFAVTAGIGIDEHVARFEASHDDYNSILLKALADRLAEAFAERLHERVRREFWGYAVDEAYDNDALIGSLSRDPARRPAISACPDHTEKGGLFALLDATNAAGIELTESYDAANRGSVADITFRIPTLAISAPGRLPKIRWKTMQNVRGWTSQPWNSGWHRSGIRTIS